MHDNSEELCDLNYQKRNATLIRDWIQFTAKNKSNGFETKKESKP